MIILYCRDASHTSKVVIAAGAGRAVGTVHYDALGVGHTNIGEIEVADDPRQPGETHDQYLARLGTKYAALMT